MTTATLEPSIEQSKQSQGKRIFNVMRMQFVAKTWLIYTPIYMIVTSFLITLAIVLIMNTAGVSTDDINKGLAYSWAILVPMWYLPSAVIIAINPTIHVAYAMSVSRREFYLGTLLAFVFTAIFQAAVLTLFGIVEKLTHGYGLNMRFVDSSMYYNKSLLETFMISTLLYFSIMAIFTAIAVIYLRWKTTGVLVSIGILIVILLGAIYLIAISDWRSTLAWIVEQTAQAFLWIGLFGAIAMIIGYLVVRRATPKD